MFGAVKVERADIVEGARESAAVVEGNVRNSRGLRGVEGYCVIDRRVVHEIDRRSLVDGKRRRTVRAREHAYRAGRAIAAAPAAAPAPSTSAPSTSGVSAAAAARGEKRENQYA